MWNNGLIKKQSLTKTKQEYGDLNLSFCFADLTIYLSIPTLIVNQILGTGKT